MNGIEGWLGGLLHPSVQSDPRERLRHERFLVARTGSTLAALVALPFYLLGTGGPTLVEALALLALASPLAGVLVLSRTGRLPVAQGLVSLALTLVGAGAAAGLGEPGAPALLALALVPLDALFSGSRRTVLIAAALTLAGAALAVALPVAEARPPADLAYLLAVALVLAFGHAAAHLVLDRRIGGLLARTRRAGDDIEGTTLETMGDLVTWHDRNGSVLRANGASASLMGIPPALLEGRGLFHRIHVSDRPAFLKAVSDAATAAGPVTVTLRLTVGGSMETGLEGEGAPPARRSAPETLWVELRAHRIAASGGDECAVVAVTRDITGHQRRVEDLEERCRRSDEAGERRAQLLATVSHELRTPLNAIIGYSELMTERGLPGGSFGAQDRASAGRGGQQGLGDPNYAGIIRETGEHMLGLVSTLLDLSTIEAGHYDLAPEPLDVADLVSEGCRTMELAAGRAGVAIAQDVAPNLPELQADRRACLQILLNLLSNAVKFTPAGGLVTVQARRDGERITLTVRDTGVGVLPGELPRLGEPFYRTPAGRSRSRSGCGLGLSVVRNLAALHGGRVHIASDPGAGLSATVSLPIDSAGCRATARIHTLPLGRGSIPLARAG